MIRSSPANSRRAFIVLACLSVAAPAADGGGTVHSPPEKLLIAALDDVQRGAVDAALSDLEALIERQPNFRLAHYLRDELLPRRPDHAVGTLLDRDSGDERHRALVDEALLRWSHYRAAPPPGAVPDAVLKLAPRFRHLVVVDLLRHRLYLWRNEGSDLKLIADFYASIGRGGVGKETEGDLRTPLGLYHVTEYKPDRELPELYGDGAFPVDYPNDIDRLRGRSGYGIWIHGVPRDTYSRSPRSSEGCVVLANNDLRLLRRHLRPGLTPVVLTDDLRWLPPEEVATRRRELMLELETWRESRESAEVERRLAHYAADFVSADGSNKAALAESMRDADRASVRLEEVSIYRYPGEYRTVSIDFREHRAEGGERTVSRRRQLWRRDPGFGWRIAYEG